MPHALTSEPTNKMAQKNVVSAWMPYRHAPGAIVLRKCACGGTPGPSGECEACHKKRLQRKIGDSTFGSAAGFSVPPVVSEVLRSPGKPLDVSTRSLMEPRFGHDFSHVRVHDDAKAADSARAEKALAYTVGRDVVFARNKYSPATSEGRKLIAHELAHVVQQKGAGPGGGGVHQATEQASEGNADALAAAALAGRRIGQIERSNILLRRRAAPYIRRVLVHLTPPQNADLEWEGTPPADATGADHFTVSTGKGYSNPGDPAGTCTRNCCTDPLTQCAPPWNRPSRVGACCTYFGNSFWTGTPRVEHNGWQWWTPIQPYYSSRGIALHQHTEVTGQPIGHGCVRMDEPNAKRIFDYSNGRRTNVTIDGRAAPVECTDDRRCAASGSSSATGSLEGASEQRFAEGTQEPIPGLEGAMT
jgi:hypothetical protein